MPKKKKKKQFICPIISNIDIIRTKLDDIDTKAGNMQGEVSHDELDSEASEIETLCADIRALLCVEK